VDAGAQMWVDMEEGRLAGALASRTMAGEAEILNLAVDAAWRRRGVGRRLMEAARQLRPPLRGATYETLFGLLAVSGVRVGEALAMGRDDVDLAEGILTIRGAKFARTRVTPLHSSATEALRLMSEESGESAPIDLTPLDRDNLGWLIQWAASKGQPIGMGKLAAQALRRALEDLDPNVRLAAVHTYAALGDVEIIPVLRARLTDDQPHVRDAAYRALEEIARRKNESVPQ